MVYMRPVSACFVGQVLYGRYGDVHHRKVWVSLDSWFTDSQTRISLKKLLAYKVNYDVADKQRTDSPPESSF